MWLACHQIMRNGIKADPVCAEAFSHYTSLDKDIKDLSAEDCEFWIVSHIVWVICEGLYGQQVPHDMCAKLD